MSNFSELKLRIAFIKLTFNNVPVVPGILLMLIAFPLNLLVLSVLLFWAIGQLFNYTSN